MASFEEVGFQQVQGANHRGFYGTGLIPCPDLGPGWYFQQIVRQHGSSAGQFDVYYYSPNKKRLRSKLQLQSFVGNRLSLENFNFNIGRFVRKDEVIQKKDALLTDKLKWFKASLKKKLSYTKRLANRYRARSTASGRGKHEKRTNKNQKFPRSSKKGLKLSGFDAFSVQVRRSCDFLSKSPLSIEKVIDIAWKFLDEKKKSWYCRKSFYFSGKMPFGSASSRVANYISDFHSLGWSNQKMLIERRKRWRCGQCDRCSSPNCGECRSCRDMKTFGGQGRLKQSCLLRICPFSSFSANRNSWCGNPRPAIEAPNECLKSNLELVPFSSSNCITQFDPRHSSPLYPPMESSYLAISGKETDLQTATLAEKSSNESRSIVSSIASRAVVPYVNSKMLHARLFPTNLAHNTSMPDQSIGPNFCEQLSATQFGSAADVSQRASNQTVFSTHKNLPSTDFTQPSNKQSSFIFKSCETNATSKPSLDVVVYKPSHPNVQRAISRSTYMPLLGYPHEVSTYESAKVCPISIRCSASAIVTSCATHPQNVKPISTIVSTFSLPESVMPSSLKREVVESEEI